MKIYAVAHWIWFASNVNFEIQTEWCQSITVGIGRRCCVCVRFEQTNDKHFQINDEQFPSLEVGGMPFSTLVYGSISISSMQKGVRVAERLLVYAKFILLLSTQRQHVKFNYSFLRMTATRERVNVTKRRRLRGHEPNILMGYFDLKSLNHSHYS